MAKDRHDPGTLDIEEWLARNPSPADAPAPRRYEQACLQAQEEINNRVLTELGEDE